MASLTVCAINAAIEILAPPKFLSTIGSQPCLVDTSYERNISASIKMSFAMFSATSFSMTALFDTSNKETDTAYAPPWPKDLSNTSKAISNILVATAPVVKSIFVVDKTLRFSAVIFEPLRTTASVTTSRSA